MLFRAEQSVARHAARRRRVRASARKPSQDASDSQAATAAAALAARGVGGHRRHVLDAADLEARARQRAQRRLRARPRRLRLVAPRRAQLDVQRGDAQLLRVAKARASAPAQTAGACVQRCSVAATRLALQGNVLGGKHSGVGRGLVAVGLHLHAAWRGAACSVRVSGVRNTALRARRGAGSSSPATHGSPPQRVPAAKAAPACRCAALRVWPAGQARALAGSANAPVTRTRVSLPDRSVMCLGSTRATQARQPPCRRRRGAEAAIRQ
jgi:hypothetical protein